MGAYSFTSSKAQSQADSPVIDRQEGRAEAGLLSAVGFERLLRMHQRALLGYAFRMVRNSEEAQDIVQCSFLKYLEKRPDCATVADQRAWLFRVTNNLCVDQLRRAKRRRLLDEAARDAEVVVDPPSAVEAKEAADRLEAMLDRLSSKQRAVITLFYQERKSYQEISSITGLSSSNVGMLLSRGLKKLRSIANREELFSL